MRGCVLLSWWGSLEGGGETIGDLWAVASVARALSRHNIAYQIASAAPYRELDHRVARWKDVSPSDVAVLVFVCGPISSESAELVSLIDQFSDNKTIAVGVSLLPTSSVYHFNPFAQVILRDGDLGHRYGDMACAYIEEAGWKPSPRESAHGVGICLRGEQREYGNGACLHGSAESFARDVAALFDLPTLYIDTRLHGDPGRPQQILSQLDRCRFLITTRLHGALLGICRGIPTLAIDQIRGGGKVASLLRDVRWPHLVFADQVVSGAVTPRSAAGALANEDSENVAGDVTARLIAGAEAALSELMTLLGQSLPGD